jgi:hypothetical protein
LHLPPSTPPSSTSLPTSTIRIHPQDGRSRHGSRQRRR